jgi:predicted phosphoribosyltransferase
MRTFRDRREAGRALAQELRVLSTREGVVVLALPRGGVPVAYEIAKALDAPLDIFVVRKLGVPGHEEVAFGAIASGGVRALNADIVRALDISSQAIESTTRREARELERREEAYREGRPFLGVQGRIVILVDDGVATGATMRVAIDALRLQSPRTIIVATPVASAEAYHMLRRHADECICLLVPQSLIGVGLWYDDFSQTSDEEVRTLLRDAELPQRGAAAAPVA